MADRKINFTDILGPVGAASDEQKASLRAALGTGGISDEQIEALVSDADFSPERTLTHVFGRSGTDWGEQPLANMVQLGHLAQLATGSVLGRKTSGTGDVEALSATDLRTILAYGTTGKGDIGTAITALAADATAGVALGSDAATALSAWFADDAASFYAFLDAVGIPYFTSQWSEGQNVIASADATAEIEGVAGIDLAAISSPSAVTSSAGTLTIDWAAGTKFRTHTTTQNTAIVSSNLQTYEAARMIVTGGGAHTITFPSGARVSTGYASGLTVASGEKYALIFMHDGTDLLISVSSEFVEVA